MTTATHRPTDVKKRCERCNKIIYVRRYRAGMRRFCARCAKADAHERASKGVASFGGWLSNGERRKLHEGF